MGGAHDARIFDRTPPNPTETATLEALAQYEAASCDGVMMACGAAGGTSAAPWPTAATGKPAGKPRVRLDTKRA